jgi:imidazole glycerol-phosphate synthase subunit HisF
MLSRRIIPCLDVRDGKLTKGIKFKENVDIGDPVEMASFYYEEGADELVFYDITASSEKRDIMIETVRSVAKKIFIPFSVGGGIRSVEDMRRVLLAGAEKVSINSAAIRDPGLITRGAEAFGSQAIVLGMDVRKVSPSPKIPSGYEMVIDGGRAPAGKDALAWAREGERLGAGEICLNSIDADGTKEGYELNLTRLIASHAHIPVIASGGAGKAEHLFQVLSLGLADAALIASVTHYGLFSIRELKSCLHKQGIKVRMNW